MKRIIFWITFPFLGILTFAVNLISLVPCTYIGAMLVFYELLSRYEWFMLEYNQYGVKQHRTPLKQCFLEGFKQ